MVGRISEILIFIGVIVLIGAVLLGVPFSLGGFTQAEKAVPLWLGYGAVMSLLAGVALNIYDSLS